MDRVSITLTDIDHEIQIGSKGWQLNLQSRCEMFRPTEKKKKIWLVNGKPTNWQLKLHWNRRKRNDSLTVEFSGYFFDQFSTHIWRINLTSWCETDHPPALSPNIVTCQSIHLLLLFTETFSSKKKFGHLVVILQTWSGSPPKRWMFSCTHFRASAWSLSPCDHLFGFEFHIAECNDRTNLMNIPQLVSYLCSMYTWFPDT